MKLLKPRRLTKIRPLPTHMEMQSLLHEILLRGFRICQWIGGVIRIDEVFYNCAGFLERDARVWVFDCGDGPLGLNFEGVSFEIAHVWEGVS
jgi:hypothetical protein